MAQKKDTIDMLDTPPPKGSGGGKTIGWIIALLVVGGAALGYFLFSGGSGTTEKVATAPSPGPTTTVTPEKPKAVTEKPAAVPSPSPIAPVTTPEKSPTEPPKPFDKAGETPSSPTSPSPIAPAATPEKFPAEPQKPFVKAGETPSSPTSPSPIAPATTPEKSPAEPQKPLAKSEPAKLVVPEVTTHTKLQPSPSLTAITTQEVIHFNPNQYKVDPSDVVLLKEFLGKISGSGGNLAIEGYADSLGPEIYNQKLSEKRAKQVAKLVASAGMNKQYQIITKGYGISQPVGDNKTPQGRAENRRVVISYSK